jgi:hypothetical protein
LIERKQNKKVAPRIESSPHLRPRWFCLDLMSVAPPVTKSLTSSFVEE